MKPVAVFPSLSKLVEGQVPPQSLLLLGPSGIGKTIFCKQFLYDGIIVGQPCIYMATDESPEEICKSMKSFGFDIDRDDKAGMLRIIDCYSWKLGRKSSNKYTVNNPANLATLSMTIEKATRGLKKTRLVLDSITGLTSICNHNVTTFSKFLQIIVARIRLTNGYAIFTAAPEAHNKQFLSFLRLTFGGILEMKGDETGKEIKRLLRIFSLRGARHQTHWTPFEITNEGIEIRNVTKKENGNRCLMCSKLIGGKPDVEIVEGKKLSFDSAECAKTYRKLKSVYGEDFE